MKKRVLSLLLAGVMVTGMAGCGSAENTADTNSSQETSAETVEASTDTSTESSEEATPASDPIDISFWCNFTGSDGDVLREIVQEFNDTNTDNITVSVDIMDYSTLLTKLPAAVSTGTGPSFMLAGIELINEYANNGMLEDIGDFWDVTGTNKDNFYENVLAKSSGSIAGATP